jgi:hypothetical protein
MPKNAEEDFLARNFREGEIVSSESSQAPKSQDWTENANQQHTIIHH